MTCPVIQGECEHVNCEFWHTKTGECLIVRYLKYHSNIGVKGVSNEQ
jgi:hypothetical protein